MARDFDPYMLSSPRIFVVRMIIFLIIAAFVPLVLYREVARAFMANPGLNGLIVGVLVLGFGLSLGGLTGYAINPASDLGPRLAHAILPIPGKGGSDWGYSWIPVIAPLIGGIAGAGLYAMVGF